ncbi:MAG TPA: hypothetical protein ENN85_09585 [Methanoculleus sp.]|nr:hypothetical protein [Methanoculleus sp.]
MRTSHRNRCYTGIAALCLVLLIGSIPAAALNATFTVAANGTAYNASIEVENADRYTFIERGLLGERIPKEVNSIRVSGPAGAVAFEDRGRGSITFPEGNYTITYRGFISDSSLQADFDQPYMVTVVLPAGLDVRNPFLGVISPGGEVTEEKDGAVIIAWETARFVEVRFYDDLRERALLIFGSFWIILCAIFILPYLIFRQKRQ